MLICLWPRLFPFVAEVTRCVPTCCFCRGLQFLTGFTAGSTCQLLKLPTYCGGALLRTRTRDFGDLRPFPVFPAWAYALHVRRSCWGSHSVRGKSLTPFLGRAQRSRDGLMESCLHCRCCHARPHPHCPIGWPAPTRVTPPSLWAEPPGITALHCHVTVSRNGW